MKAHPLMVWSKGKSELQMHVDYKHYVQGFLFPLEIFTERIRKSYAYQVISISTQPHIV